MVPFAQHVEKPSASPSGPDGVDVSPAGSIIAIGSLALRVGLTDEPLLVVRVPRLNVAVV